MKNPHALSAAYILDPGYSADTRIPEVEGSSLYSEGGGAGQPWLYAPGDLEAHLMAEARLRAFRSVNNVAHPGYFRPPHRSVYFTASLALDQDALPGGAVFEHAGAMRVTVNDRFVAWWPAPAKPGKTAIDLGEFLQRGQNQILITLFGAEEPVCLRPDALFTGWRCSCDAQTWEEPQELPFVGREAFPHHETIPKFTVTARGRDENVYDFGVEVCGRLRVDVLDADAKHRFRPGESEPEIRHPMDRWAEQGDILLDARQRGDPDPDGKAFRYVRLEPGAHAAPEPEAVRCDVVVHPAAYRGAFACADPLATRIWMHAAYTLRLCMRDVTVDGLKRDRLPWVGDLSLSLIGNAYTFAEHRLCLRTLLSFYHPHPGGVDFSGIFDFTLLWIIAAGNYLLYSGDLRGARMLWPRAKIVLDAMAPLLSAEGLLQSEQAAWVFIDWADLPRQGVLLVVQALYLQALDGGALLARALGETEEARRLEARAGRLRRIAGDRFWDPAQGCYADALVAGALTPNGSRHANAFATLSGIASPERAAAALQSARANSAAPAGATPYMRYFENAAYCRAGLPELMLGEVTRYWGGMIEAGATTFWEAYDARHTGDERYGFYGRPFGKSLCHAWASGPLSLYSSDLFGLKPVTPGWKTFTFSPAAASIPWAAVCVPTPAGPIRAEFEGDAARIEVPPGCAVVDAEGVRRFAAPEEQSARVALRRQGAVWLPT